MDAIFFINFRVLTARRELQGSRPVAGAAGGVEKAGRHHPRRGSCPGAPTITSLAFHLIDRLSKRVKAVVRMIDMVSGSLCGSIGWQAGRLSTPHWQHVQDVMGDTKLDADGYTDVTGVWSVAGNKLTLTGSVAAGTSAPSLNLPALPCTFKHTSRHALSSSRLLLGSALRQGVAC